MRARILVPIAVAAAAITVLSLYVVRSETPPVAISPTPTASATAAPTATPSAPATATPTATAQPSPSPTARPTPIGPYANGDMGYALDLKPAWHRTSCGSSISGGQLHDRAVPAVTAL